MIEQDVNIFEKVVSGDVRLLSAEQICDRLGVSRTTFDRWVRNAEALDIKSAMKAPKTIGPNTFIDHAANLAEGKISFPKPDVRIGKSPRWTFETVVEWLKTNSSF